MGRPLRHQSKDAFYLITNRCADGQFLLRPDPECRRIIAGCLARQAAKKNVRLVCFSFISGHFHLIAGFPEMNRDTFMGDLTGQISDRVNTLRGRSGPMFPIRYDDVRLCDDQVLREKICYVLNNPVKDGLVANASAWPGVSSMDCHETGNPFEGRWLNHERWKKLSRRKTTDHERCEAMEHYSVELHVPEALDGDTDSERRESMIDLVEKDRQRIHAQAEEEIGAKPKFLGPAEVLRQDCRDRPKNSDVDAPTRTKHRRFASSEPGGTAAYRQKHRERTREYRDAVDAMRNGERSIFPHGMHPPGHPRCIGHADACELYHASVDS
jgi:hypothetical protein